MLDILCKLFIKDYKNTEDSKVRERYGTVISFFSILCNIILVIIKMIIATLTGSISIRADALNNLSDVGSNVATLFGFKLANKHADKDHPYGHGRMEYISGIIVTFFIVLMGFSSFKESLLKIFEPYELIFTYAAIISLSVSILIKLIMFYVNKEAGKRVKSDALSAAGQDSLNDSLTTFATLISLIILKVFNLNIDAYIGLIVSILILKSGIGLFKDVMDTILGKAPDKELVKAIEDTILSHKEIHGIHDFMLHDYGPSNQFVTLHGEVDAKEDIIDIHDVIDNIEIEIYQKFGIISTIHMDPIDFSDPLTNELNAKVKELVKKYNPEYSIHDFRIVKGPTHTNLVFDLLLPADETASHEKIKNDLVKEIYELGNGKFYAVIKVEHAYI